MKTYCLKHNLEFDLTRSVPDMAALFAYYPADEAEVVLRVEYINEAFIAILEKEGLVWKSAPVICEAPVSGEVSRSVKLAVLDAFTQMTGQSVELPWGILTGVRPGKLAHKIVDAGTSFAILPSYLQNKYLLPEEQARLLTNICKLQKQLVPDEKKEAGIYIGIPFCPSKCSYCSFPSGIVPKDEESQQNFLNFIEQDIKNVVKLLGVHSLNVTSLYIGGGTPTSLSEGAFTRLLQMAADNLLLPSIREFTVEAGRPDCFTQGKLDAMEAVGVNRISVNPQTFHDKTLKLIGRAHTIEDFYRAYEMTAKSKIPVINTDLIIGLPGESEEDIAFSLQKAAELKPHNLTVHTLTLKRDSALFGSQIGLPAESAARMVRKGQEVAAEMGMHPYYLYRQHYMLGHLANIGYALPGTESIYNVQMMEERHTVIGIGPSSATKLPHADGHHISRLSMPKNIFTYTSNIQQLGEKRRLLFEE
ncbi:MAG: coproporphyrinogen dehydrogenase HemZ [Phascolarctobacterium sp.]|nr:coproporphyrinogen dehydrogenase HemZ [Phascolarctobacterium sp.]